MVKAESDTPAPTPISDDIPAIAKAVVGEVTKLAVAWITLDTVRKVVITFAQK